MTTSRSPLRVLKAQADGIAKTIKAISRGEDVGVADPQGKIAASRAKGIFKPVVLMDDKLITFEMPWKMVEETSEVALAEYILKKMRDHRVEH